MSLVLSLVRSGRGGGGGQTWNKPQRSEEHFRNKDLSNGNDCVSVPIFDSRSKRCHFIIRPDNERESSFLIPQKNHFVRVGGMELRDLFCAMINGRWQREIFVHDKRGLVRRRAGAKWLQADTEWLSATVSSFKLFWSWKREKCFLLSFR
ncbi:hypothetical protein AVEN_157237-1 [Araneus ventricosus]|uniref:Uncharacterized protein n=1 Tax=Araneus ventricosus TaxID=182803 RepID=A0A4Y2VUG9_ARAVE|nr:hypothetical protein AVEN_47302-1 [Araneus ventricosus]GBO28802.1 hypothetical protein AVEN_157237-1 [Araneus ventricosus]